MAALDDKIDDLYREPLAAFTGARSALAKSLTGADAARVRRLQKPTIVPWAINQVYWHARPAYDALMKSGNRLRQAQLAVLEGRRADVRAANDAHRRALAEAVRAAERFAGEAGSSPSRDALMRTFEALSVRSPAQEPPGRLTRPLEPAGFEALGALRPTDKTHTGSRSDQPDKPSASSKAPRAASARMAAERRADEAERRKQEAALRRREAAQRKREAAQRRKAEAAQRRRDADVKKAEAALERARRRMAEAELKLRAARDT